MNGSPLSGTVLCLKRDNLKRILLKIFLLVCQITIIGSLSSCSTSRKTIKNQHTKSEVVSNAHLSKFEKALIKEAESWIGTPYLYAGNEKGIGVDCSGMVLQIYLTHFNIKLPRNSAKQAEFCQKIREKDVKIGDLVFFATGKDPDIISHVGIMLDKTNFIHASSKKGVVISSMENPYYKRTFKLFGRPKH